MLEAQLLLFEGCDLLDVGGPYEVLLTANRVAAETGAPRPFDVQTVSATGGEVTSYGGMALRPHRQATPAGGAPPDEITEAFDRHGVATLKGDWTNRDPQITRLLEEYGRSGVPLYLWYPAGHQGPGEILPQILTRSRVLEALSSQKVAK
jgi:transcriptional regulator GlxA family with amidase domain